MKKLVLLLIFILLIPSVIAICCQNIGNKEGGCYPGRGICCEETDKVVGYIGCKAVLDSNKPTDYSYYCPEKFLGTCLQCSSNCSSDGTDCNWKEVDKCTKEGLSCVIEYLSGTKIPSIISSCTNKCMEGEVEDLRGNCIKIKDAEDKGIEVSDCTNAMCTPKKCCGTNGKFKEGEGSICSGDNDKDGRCNYYDNCPEVPNTGTLGTCLPLTIKKTCTKKEDCPGGTCSNNQDDSDQDDIGDACEFEGRCESAYSDRQCCDLLPGTTLDNTIGVGTSFGKTTDCPGPIGCYTQCVTTIKDAQGKNIEITYEVGPCMDGQRTVKKLQDGKAIETKTEACSGIPLIPFFTNINLLATFLILTLFYYFREK